VIARIAFFGAAALAMAVAVFDITGSAVIAMAAAALPLALGATNIMPFAGWALPMAAVIWALAARMPAPQADAAASHSSRAVLAAAAD
jgi:hypothetical protein